jgi:hypothetical protein
VSKNYTLECSAEAAVQGIPVLRVKVLHGDEQLQLAALQRVAGKAVGITDCHHMVKAVQAAHGVQYPVDNSRWVERDLCDTHSSFS